MEGIKCYVWFIYWLSMAGSISLAGVYVVQRVQECLRIRAIRRWAKKCRKSNEGCL
jgi:hypothetical protein